MIYDIISNEEYLFLGSRLKRLSDNLLNDAAKILQAEGYLGLYPSHMSIIGVLAKIENISITNLANNLGLAQPSVTRSIITLKKLNIVEIIATPKDSRQKLVRLTENGKKIEKKLRKEVWAKIEIIMRELLTPKNINFMDQITKIEQELKQKSFFERFENMKNQTIEIIEYMPIYADDFYNINAEWIEELFILEEIDQKILKNPEDYILNNGGIILLARHNELGIIGTCALMNMENGYFELTKMGVKKNLRGMKIGEKLLLATINRAIEMKVPNLFLLTNKKAEAAIHLYEKLGFEHSSEIMEAFGHEYERCDVAMKFVKMD